MPQHSILCITALGAYWVCAYSEKHFAYPAKHLYESILKDNKRVGFLPEPASGSEAVVPSGCIPALGGAGSADTDVCDHQVPQWMPLKQTGLMAIKSQVQSMLTKMYQHS